MIYSHIQFTFLLLIYSRNTYGIYWLPTIVLSVSPLAGEGTAVSQFLCSEDQFFFSFFFDPLQVDIFMSTVEINFWKKK